MPPSTQKPGSGNASLGAMATPPRSHAYSVEQARLDWIANPPGIYLVASIRARMFFRNLPTSELQERRRELTATRQTLKPLLVNPEATGMDGHRWRAAKEKLEHAEAELAEVQLQLSRRNSNG